MEIKTTKEIAEDDYLEERDKKEWVSVDSLKDLINSANFYEDIVKQIEKELEEKDGN